MISFLGQGPSVFDLNNSMPVMMTPADDITLSIMWKYYQFNRRKPHLQVLTWHLIVSPMDWLHVGGGGGCFYSRICCNWWEWVRPRLSCRSGLRETGLCSFVAVWFEANYLVLLRVLTVRKASDPFSCSVMTVCDPMDCSTAGFPVHHQLPELIQTHVHQVGDAIQPSHPLSSPSPPTFKY